MEKEIDCVKYVKNPVILPKNVLIKITIILLISIIIQKKIYS